MHPDSDANYFCDLNAAIVDSLVSSTLKLAFSLIRQSSSNSFWAMILEPKFIFGLMGLDSRRWLVWTGTRGTSATKATSTDSSPRCPGPGYFPLVSCMHLLVVFYSEFSSSTSYQKNHPLVDHVVEKVTIRWLLYYQLPLFHHYTSNGHRFSCEGDVSATDMADCNSLIMIDYISVVNATRVSPGPGTPGVV